MKYKIGYIDEDKDQVRLFKRKLKKYNFNVIEYDIKKGMPINELIKQVYESGIDLLMVDYLLKDSGLLTYNGDEIERLFNEIKPKFPHIIFTSNENDAFSAVDDPNIIYEKEMVLDDNRVDRFVEILKKNIENYQLFQKIRKDKIEDLLKKGEAEGLTAIDKDNLLSLQQELQNLDKIQKREVPLQLTSTEVLEDLSRTRIEAADFLQSLIDKRASQ